LPKIERLRESTLGIRTSNLLELFSQYPNIVKDLNEIEELIIENGLEDNESFIMARDCIFGIDKQDYEAFNIEQLLYVMMTHIHYYRIPKPERINAENRNIQKTADTVKSLLENAEELRKQGKI